TQRTQQDGTWQPVRCAHPARLASMVLAWRCQGQQDHTASATVRARRCCPSHGCRDLRCSTCRV
ncbi:hypothetical protein BC831DRAFT_480362, partial [Entophlyctis helioformis]